MELFRKRDPLIEDACQRMLSVLDPTNTILLVCDIQEAFANTIYGFGEMVEATAFLMKCCRLLNVPIIVTEQYPEKLKGTVSQLLSIIQEADSIPVFAKVEFSMITSEVKAYMQDHLICAKNVILCGLETHVCVMQTAMELKALGYNVQVCADAVSSRSQVDRKVALDRLSHNGIDLTTTECIAFQFIRSKTHPQFRSISSLVKEKTLPNLLGV